MSKGHNQGKEIVYVGSPHEARNTPPDWCKTPPSGTILGYPNYVSSALLKSPAATVQVGGMPVMTMDSTIGPPSSPEHAGTMGGTRSGTYRGEAAPIVGSPDMTAEGAAVIRSDDRMRLNNANTVGKMMGTGSGSDGSGVMALRKQKCFLEELVGFSTKDGQHLGYRNAAKSGDPSYLEVLQGDEVQFISRRRDLETDALFPDCAAGEAHTKFTFSITPYPFGNGRSQTFEGIDQHKISADDAITLLPEWLTKEVDQLLGISHSAIDAQVLNALGISITAEEIRTKGNEIYNSQLNLANEDVRDHRDRVAEHGAEVGDQTGSILEEGGSASSRRKAARQLAEQKLIKEKMEAAQKKYHWDGAKFVVNTLWQVFKLWHWMQHPPTIGVLAQSCSGAKAAFIVVYPKEKYKWEITHTVDKENRDGWISNFIDNCDKFKDSVQKARNLCEAAAPEVSFDVKILDTYVFSLEAQFKRCTKDKEIINPLNGRVLDYITPAHIRLDWTFSISLAPLISLEFSHKYNALKLLGLVFPGLGNAAGWLLDRLNTGIYATFSISFSLTITGSLGFNQDYEITNPKIATTINITPSLILSIEVTRWVELVKITFACSIDLTGEVELALEKTPKVRLYGSWSYTTTANLKAGRAFGYTWIEFPDDPADAKVDILSGGTGAGGDPYDPTAKRVLFDERALGGT